MVMRVLICLVMLSFPISVTAQSEQRECLPKEAMQDFFAQHLVVGPQVAVQQARTVTDGAKILKIDLCRRPNAGNDVDMTYEIVVLGDNGRVSIVVVDANTGVLSNRNNEPLQDQRR